MSGPIADEKCPRRRTDLPEMTGSRELGNWGTGELGSWGDVHLTGDCSPFTVPTCPLM